MTTDLLPKTRELVSKSQFAGELSEFTDWLSAERYTRLCLIWPATARLLKGLMSEVRSI